MLPWYHSLVNTVKGLGDSSGAARGSGAGGNEEGTVQVAGDIVFLGDSLIEFFDWEKRFPMHRVRNLGVAGETVEGLKERAGRITGDIPRADFAFIMTGINNVAMEDTGFLSPYRSVVEEFRTAWPACRIYVQSLLPTDLPWIHAHTIEFLNGRIEDLARACGVEYLDVHAAFMARGPRACLSADGIHLSPAGYALWADLVERTIVAFLDRAREKR
jgi:lysophospholipase L1-like esterase